MSNATTAYTNAREFINARPGFCGFNYSTRADYQRDYRRATKYKDPALELLKECARLDLDIRGRTGNLTIDDDGMIDLIVGQYRPTEYRRAMFHHLASVLAQDLRYEIIEKHTPRGW